MGHTQHSSELRIGQVSVEIHGQAHERLGCLLERIDFHSWVERSVPVVEVSPNSYGVYCKMLAHLLTVCSSAEREGCTA